MLLNKKINLLFKDKKNKLKWRTCWKRSLKMLV